MSKTIETLRILVVDDDPDQRMLMIAHLNRLGVTDCSEAADGKEALALLSRSQEFDLIFTDNQMPGMDGPDFIRTLRDLKAYAHLKVVMASDNLSDNENKYPAEVSLREFLAEHNVLPVPKDRLNRDVLREILEELLMD